MYEVAKDFVPSILTLIAAGVALRISYRFGRIQADIAKSQRDIALDKLKFDLFRSRYEIYEAVKKLLEYVPFIDDIAKSDSTKIRSLYVKMDEARFYFPSDICAILDAIHKRCEHFMEQLAQRDRINLIDDGHRDEWSQLADILAKDQTALRQTYGSLPQIFEKVLAFKQLTSNA
jgi:hypothetical protein